MRPPSGPRSLRPAAAALVLALAACSAAGSARSPTGDSAEPYPKLAGVPEVEPYSGPDTRTVLLIGDSVMQQTAPFVELSLRRLGLAGEVVNAGESGSAVVGAVGVDWHEKLPRLLERYRPDVVVAHFAGHGVVTGAEVGTGPWYEGVHRGALSVVDAVEASGASMYWVVPPVVSWPDSLKVDGEIPYPAVVFRAAADWYREELPAARPAVELVDWRSVLSPHERYTKRLRLRDGSTLTVRFDTAHLSVAGAQIAALITVAAIRPEWQ